MSAFTGEVSMNRNILLVDDEVAFLLPMRKMLHGPGIHVDTAETYVQAMEHLHEAHYDAVIADIRLGGILSREGLEILDFIKARDGNTKVIIMTGFGGPDVMKEAYDLQADYYFEKPVSYKTLSLALSELGVMDHENA
jgi:DNA-binding NtrC family response regulator